MSIDECTALLQREADAYDLGLVVRYDIRCDGFVLVPPDADPAAAGQILMFRHEFDDNLHKTRVLQWRLDAFASREAWFRLRVA